MEEDTNYIEDVKPDIKPKITTLPYYMDSDGNIMVENVKQSTEALKAELEETGNPELGETQSVKEENVDLADYGAEVDDVVMMDAGSSSGTFSENVKPTREVLKVELDDVGNLGPGEMQSLKEEDVVDMTGEATKEKDDAVMDSGSSHRTSPDNGSIDDPRSAGDQPLTLLMECDDEGGGPPGASGGSKFLPARLRPDAATETDQFSSDIPDKDKCISTLMESGLADNTEIGATHRKADNENVLTRQEPHDQDCPAASQVQPCSGQSSRRWDDWPEMKRHHTGNILPSCSICGHRSRWGSHVNKHMRLKHGAKGCHKCYVCNKRFVTGPDLIEHWQTHSEIERNLGCVQNEGAVSSQPGIHHDAEKDASHPDKRSDSDLSKRERDTVDCKNKRRNNLCWSDDKRQHTGNLLPNCAVCGHKSKQGSYVNKHMRLKHGAKGCYKCCVCNKRFVTGTDLIEHRQTHSEIERRLGRILDEDERVVSCQQEIDFDKEKDASHSEKERDASCPEKEGEASDLEKERDASDLEKEGDTNDLEKERDPVNSEKKYGTSLSTRDGKLSLPNENRKNKGKTNTTKQRKPGCGYCDYKCNNISNLYRHMRCVHGAKGCCQCSVCMKHFMSGSDLYKHKLVHSQNQRDIGASEKKRDSNLYGRVGKDRKVYEENDLPSCATCGFKATSTTVIQKHMRLFHGAAGVYKCRVGLCKKSFVTGSELIRHMQTHSEKEGQLAQIRKKRETSFRYQTGCSNRQETTFSENEKHTRICMEGRDASEPQKEKTPLDFIKMALGNKKLLDSNRNDLYIVSKLSSCGQGVKMFQVLTIVPGNELTHSNKENFNDERSHMREDDDTEGVAQSTSVSLSDGMKKSCHEIPGQYTCHLCNKGFVTGSLLSTHYTRHFQKLTDGSEVRVKKFEKENSQGGSFTAADVGTGSGLVKDMTSPESKAKNSLFARGTGNTSVIERHTSIEGQSYNVARSFSKVDVRKHAGKMPYSCGVCGKIFSWSSSLHYHLALRHRARGHFRCCHCNRGFTSGPDLNRHKLSHVEEVEEDFQLSDKTASDQAVQVSQNKNNGTQLCGDVALPGKRFDESKTQQSKANVSDGAEHRRNLGKLKRSRCAGILTDEEEEDTQEVDLHDDDKNGEFYAVDDDGNSEGRAEKPIADEGRDIDNNFDFNPSGADVHVENVASPYGSMHKESSFRMPPTSGKLEKVSIVEGRSSGKKQESGSYRTTKYAISKFEPAAKFLLERIRKVCSKRPYQCGICDKISQTGSSQRKHLRHKHRAQEGRTCHLCRKGFLNGSDLTRHKLSHSLEENAALVLLEMKNTDTGDGRLQNSFPFNASCDDEEEILESQSDNLVANGGQQKNSSDCTWGKKFGFASMQTSKTADYERSSEIKSRQSVNHVCSMQSSEDAGYLRLREIYGRQPPSCGVCGKIFTYSSNRNMHLRKMHAAEDRATCLVCNKAYRTAEDLAEHKLCHAREAEEALVAMRQAMAEAVELRQDNSKELSSCLLGVQSSGDTNVERVRKTDTRPPPSCGVCGRIFSVSSNRNMHLRKMHAAKDRATCLVCNKAFPTAAGLAKHKLCHAGEGDGDRSSRPAQGEDKILEHSFTVVENGDNAGTLVKSGAHESCRSERLSNPVARYYGSESEEIMGKSHKIDATTQLKMTPKQLIYRINNCYKKMPYKCDVCGHVARNSTRWQKHMRTKHGADECFTCLLCRTGFLSRSCLNRHKLRHSLQEQVVLALKEKQFATGMSTKLYQYQMNFATGGSHGEIDSDRKHLNRGMTGQGENCRFAFGSALSGMGIKFRNLKRAVDRRAPACGVCGKTFSSGTNRHKHMRHAHGSKGIFRCHLCNKAFVTGPGLRAHTRKTFHELRKIREKPGSSCEGKKLGLLPEGKKSGLLHEGKKSDLLPEGKESGLLCEGKKAGPLSEGKRPVEFQPSTSYALARNKAPSTSEIGNRNSPVVSVASDGEDKIKHAQTERTCQTAERHTVKILSMKDLLAYMKDTSGEMPHSCGVCGSTFSRPSSQQKHMRTLHQAGCLIACRLCNRGFVTQLQLDAHNLAHAGKLESLHKMADDSFTEEMHFESRVYGLGVVEDGNSVTSTQTVFNGKDRERFNILNIVCQLQKEPVKRKAEAELFVCELCSKTFRHERDLMRHLRWHEGKRSYICDLCGMSFVEKTCLRRHMRTHTGERPFKCIHCGKTYKSNSNLTFHYKQQHPGADRYRCPLCHQGFTSFLGLCKHKAETPCSNKNTSNINVKRTTIYVCTYCLKQFRDKSELRNHRESHTGGTPYECTTCGFKTEAKGILHLHVRKHARQKRHPCAICGKVLYSSGYLTNHCLQVHQSLRQFTCDLCEKTFESVQELYKHTLDKCHSSPV